MRFVLSGITILVLGGYLIACATKQKPARRPRRPAAPEPVASPRAAGVAEARGEGPAAREGDAAVVTRPGRVDDVVRTTRPAEEGPPDARGKAEPAEAAAPPQPAKYVPEHYGPVPDRKIDETKVTYFVSAEGHDANGGRTRRKAFRTMQKAADTVKPGETVLVAKGTYKHGFHYKGEGREDAWVTFVAEPGAEIRGSDVRKDWKREPGKAPVHSIPRPELHGGYWQRPDLNLQQRVEQVFVNGKLLRQVPEKAMLKPKGTFYVDDGEKKLYACLKGGKDPNLERTEVSMRTWAISIGGPPNNNLIFQPQFKNLLEACRTSYVRVDGFRLRHLANFTRFSAINVGGFCHHIIVENCDVQWVNYCAIGVGARPGHISVRHNICSNNGAQGTGGGGTSDVTFEYNVLDGNNYKGISPWAEGGPLKTGFWGDRIVIRGNVARNNHNHGLWIDYGGEDCVFENNLVYNSIAGAILDEVTPCPPEKGPDRPLEVVRKLGQRGSIIRNNVLIGTRTPGGGGVNVSSSTDTRVYNNVIMGCAGGGINFGGSPTRRHTNGLFNNEAWANITYDNFLHATVIKDEDDKTGRFFNNVMHDNLFIKQRADKPFKISGLLAGPDEFEAFNKGRKNFYADAHVFKDPEHWDFTITDVELARKIGFDPDAMQLDWSRFFVTTEQKVAKRAAREYTPIDLSRHFNRALVDETAGDGKGGWSDQGGNDMSRLPVGRQTFDGVEYLVGPQDKGAVLLATPIVKPGGFPDAVTVKVGASFQEVYFLYTQAWAKTGEAARFIVEYEDRGRAELPVVNGKQIFDWWTDPTWQQHAALNDSGCYVAWQGPNRQVGRVTVYHMKWMNENPEKKIRSITVTNRLAGEKSVFFLLAITGANPRQGKSARVFHLDYDGDVDAADSFDEDIEAQGLNRAAFDAGRFVDGVKGKAFVPGKPVHYGVPPDWPLGGQGTISIWLKADDWRTPDRRQMHRNAGYTRRMWPFAGEGSKKTYSPWSIWIDIDEKNLSDLSLLVDVCANGFRKDVTNLVKPGKWFNVLVTWQPQPGRPDHTRSHVYLDGKLLGTKDRAGRTDLVGEKLWMGCPSNGGQPWRGAMDEFVVWNHYFPPERVAEYVGSFPR